MTTEEKADQQYLDELAQRLRLCEVPGPRIGEILAEARAHAAASGEPLRESFGDPADYARQWAPADHRPVRMWLRALPFGLVAGAGTWALAAGAGEIAHGGTVLGLPGVQVALIGAAVMIIAAVVLPIEPVLDPFTGDRWPLPASRRRSVVLFVVAAAAAIGTVMFLLGLLVP